MSPVVKKKAEKKKIPPKYALLAVTVLCIILMALTYNGKIGVGPGSAIAGAVLVPLQKGLTSVCNDLVEEAGRRRNLDEMIEENKKLQEEIDTLQAENARLMQDRYELTELRALYELDQAYEDYDTVGARVIGADSGSWFDSFIIDKGSEDGIEVNMNVMAGAGLVGIVSSTGSHWARVNTIIADNSNVSAMVLHTQDHLIVSGSMQLIEQGRISYSQLIDDDSQVQKGDKVVTSNISDKYLPGILIGYISSINLDSNQLTKSGLLAPVADFEHLSQVLIITRMKESYDQTKH